MSTSPHSFLATSAVKLVFARSWLRRTRVAIGVALTAVLCSAGLATAGGLLPDPVPESYAGSYALFHGDKFVGRIHSLRGCYTDVAATIATNGAIAAGDEKTVSCKFRVGLQMQPEFRADVVNVVQGKDVPMREYTVGRIAGGTVTSGITFTGFVGDVKLPSMRAGTAATPAWIEVELLNHGGSYTQTKSFSGQVPKDSAGIPIEASAPMFALDHMDPTGFAGIAGIDPITIDHREQQDGSGMPYPGKPRAGESQLRLRGSAPITVSEFERWHVDMLEMDHFSSRRTLTVRYADATGRFAFELALTAVMPHLDPMERTDGMRLAGMAFADTPSSAGWSVPQ
jgi:hypothetical protein